MKTSKIVASVIVLTTTIKAEELTGDVFLILHEGIAQKESADRYSCDMELELTIIDGKFEPVVWGYAISFNKAYHSGEIIKAEGNSLSIKLILQPDRWFPAKPGEAYYDITLEKDKTEYKGTFTGKLKYPGNDGNIIERDVKGYVSGKITKLWSKPSPDFQKLLPGEHPRLIFRKKDLPVIKQRLETETGKAILERFFEQLPKNHSQHPKTQPYFPAGYALAYQLTGNEEYAKKAKELIENMFNLKGSQDIHYGPMAQAMAITLDMCYDAWDPVFRQKAIDNLAKRLIDLYEAKMSGVSLNPYHNHEAIRVSGIALAGICLIGEKTSDGREIPNLEMMLNVAARNTRRYFLYNGITGSGWGMEGEFYKRMTWNSGPGHVIQAFRTALGIDLLADGIGSWTILGEWMWQPPNEKIVQSEGLRTDQDSGLFIFGLVTIPKSMKGVARWLFDHSYGLNGDKTFNMLWAYHAGYLLINYPFNIPPLSPSESSIWFIPDPDGGHWIFRKPWKGAEDTLIVLNSGFNFPGGTHWLTGKRWDIQLFALGKLWVGDYKMNEVTPGAGSVLPTTDPPVFTDMLGAELIDWNATPDGKAILHFDMSPIYMKPLAKGAKVPEGVKAIRMSRGGYFIDIGIHGERWVLIDLTGKSGADVLMAFLDKFSTNITWNLKLAGGKRSVEENLVIVGEKEEKNMKVKFVSEKLLTLTDTITAKGSNEYFVIITIQKGAGPEIKVNGNSVKIGNQTIKFENNKLTFSN